MKDIVSEIVRLRYMMNRNPHGVEVSKEEFNKQLLKFNVIRESWWNADVYYINTNNGRRNIGMYYFEGSINKYFLE